MNTLSIRSILIMMLTLLIVGIVVGAVMFESAGWGALLGGFFAGIAGGQQLLLKASQPFWDWLDTTFER